MYAKAEALQVHPDAQCHQKKMQSLKIGHKPWTPISFKWKYPLETFHFGAFRQIFTLQVD